MEFVRAKDKTAALEYLAQRGAAVAVLAGGTDLMRQIARGSCTPESVLYMGSLQDLRFVEHKDRGGRRIGALATQADLAESRYSTETTRPYARPRRLAAVGKAAMSRLLVEICAMARRKLTSSPRCWCTTLS